MVSSGKSDPMGIRDLLNRVVALADEDRKRLRELLSGVPLGHEKPSDEEFAQAFEMRVAASPPVPLVFPDGSEAELSPFVAMLGYVDGGRETLERYETIRGLR